MKHNLIGPNAVLTLTPSDEAARAVQAAGEEVSLEVGSASGKGAIKVVKKCVRTLLKDRPSVARKTQFKNWLSSWPILANLVRV